MKINSIKIQKIRGIVDLEIKPNGKNIVIYGDNGTGKSAVIDAIDFLLTGDISRLKGEGTGEVSVQKNGPHIGFSPKEARVSAKMESVNGKHFIVERRMSQKDKVIIEDEFKKEFNEMEIFAKNGAHFLSRKELLKYVISKPSNRASQIQTLLNIDDLKNVREILYKSGKQINQKWEGDNFQMLAKKAEYERMFEDNEGGKIGYINKLRSVLGVEPISDIEIEFAQGITFTINKEEKKISKSINEIKILNDYLKEYDNKILECKARFLSIQDRYRKEYSDIKVVDSTALIKSGLKLVGDGSCCPLCLQKWDNNDISLQDFLNGRLKSNERLSNIMDDYSHETSVLSSMLKQYNEHLAELLPLLENEFLEESKLIEIEMTIIEGQKEIINTDVSQVQSMISFINKYEKEHNASEIMKRLSAVSDTLNKQINDKYKEKENAFEKLKDLDVRKNSIDVLGRALTKDEMISARCKAMLDIFDSARDCVLNELFCSISQQFTDIYRFLHGNAEENFTATLCNSKNSVSMQVDFHEMGEFPPIAYHSEGHQDSMGIALFFALMEQMTTKESGLVLLDDVVMSVDINHRMKLCELLKTRYPNIQFIITTHEFIWAEYLKQKEVVKKSNLIKFIGWNVESGPVIADDKDVWTCCREKANDDLNGAAAYMRREMEMFFERLCDRFSSKVPYNSVHRWDYGTYENAAYKSLNDAFKDAERHSRKYIQDTKLIEIQAAKEHLDSSRKAVQENNWITNRLVHNNPQYHFSKEEFLEAVQAMQVYSMCYECPTCNSLLSITMEDLVPNTLSCECGATLYKLS